MSSNCRCTASDCTHNGGKVFNHNHKYCHLPVQKQKQTLDTAKLQSRQRNLNSLFQAAVLVYGVQKIRKAQSNKKLFEITLPKASTSAEEASFSTTTMAALPLSSTTTALYPNNKTKILLRPSFAKLDIEDWSDTPVVENKKKKNKSLLKQVMFDLSELLI